MKKIFVCVALILSLLLMCCCIADNCDNNQYLRLHIRANSNCESDQHIKLAVRNEIISFLSPYMEKAKNRADAENIIRKYSVEIKEQSEKILIKNGFIYGCEIEIKNEKFPTKNYGDLVLEEGYYRAVIVNLGKAEGDNWWCVAFPPLCFAEDGEDVIYKSIIWEKLKK